jgi:hypothetical protein
MALYRGKLLFIPLIFFLSGCCQRKVKIARSAYANTEYVTNGFSKHSSFIVLPSPSESDDTLLGKEVGKKISIVLQDNGYSTVKQKKDADYCLFYAYGMKSETRTINELKYIPGETITTTGTVSGAYGRCNNYSYYGQHQQQSRSSGSFIYVPEQYTFYSKFLTCHIYDKKNNKKTVLNKKPENKSLLWYGAAINNDLSVDLRSTLDFLIISLLDLLGINTQEIDTVTMYEKDERVTSLRSTYLEHEIE